MRAMIRLVRPACPMSCFRALEKMLVTRPVKQCARRRLFCFPWAGGGTGYFAKWASQFPADIEVCVVRLPCRELRISDEPYPDWPAMIDDIIDTLLPKFAEMPYSFFGHSFGALLASEVARHVQYRHGLHPQHIFVSGTYAPQGDKRRRDRHQFTKLDASSDQEFIACLKQNGGTPTELLENEALLKVFLPSMKQDFRLVGQYMFEGNIPVLACPISFFDGLLDRKHDIEVWREMTSSAEFDIHLLPGGHFFLLDKSNQQKIISTITMKIQ